MSLYSRNVNTCGTGSNFVIARGGPNCVYRTRLMETEKRVPSTPQGLTQRSRFSHHLIIHPLSGTIEQNTFSAPLFLHNTLK